MGQPIRPTVAIFRHGWSEYAAGGSTFWFLGRNTGTGARIPSWSAYFYSLCRSRPVGLCIPLTYWSQSTPACRPGSPPAGGCSPLRSWTPSGLRQSALSHESKTIYLYEEKAYTELQMTDSAKLVKMRARQVGLRRTVDLWELERWFKVCIAIL